MVRGYVYGLVSLKMVQFFSSWFVEIFLFQSTELEELDDRARLVSPQRSSIKAVVRENTNRDNNQIHFCIRIVAFKVFAMYYSVLYLMTVTVSYQ